jgi:hypothetical protein
MINKSKMWKKLTTGRSVADPDPESGVYFYPGIREERKIRI